MDSKNDPTFVIDIKDPSLCDKMTIKLFDEKGNVIKEVTRNVRCKSETTTYPPVVYQKYYGYNIKGVDSDEVAWEKYVNGVIELIEKRGFGVVNSMVQGPKYEKDFENTDKYGKYQYLKMKAY